MLPRGTWFLEAGARLGWDAPPVRSGHGELSDHALRGVWRSVLAAALGARLPTREGVVAGREVERLDDARSRVRGSEVAPDVEPQVLRIRPARRPARLRRRRDVLGGLPCG